MSILFRKHDDGGDEARSLSYQDVWGPGQVWDPTSGAMSLVPLYAATSLIADQFASTPVSAYDKGSSEVPVRLKRQPVLLTDPGVNGLDLYSWKHQAIASCLLRGNAYGLIRATTVGGVPTKISWLNPNDVQIDESTGTPVYLYKGGVINRQDLIHIPAYVQAGSVEGLSPLALFKVQVETANRAQEFGKNWFKRGGIPSGVLRNTARTLTAEQAQQTKARFKASVSASEPFVTGNDWDYTAITIPGGEASFIAALKMTATQFAAIYRVPPEDIGGESGGTSLTYKSLEQDMIRFAIRTLRPWTSRFESVFNQYLPGHQYVKFNLDATARADLQTRMLAHKTAIDAGVETITEARAYEEREPLTDAQWEEFMKARTTAQTITSDDSVTGASNDSEKPDA